jgi:hypothetical protein
MPVDDECGAEKIGAEAPNEEQGYGGGSLDEDGLWVLDFNEEQAHDVEALKDNLAGEINDPFDGVGRDCLDKGGGGVGGEVSDPNPGVLRDSGEGCSAAKPDKLDVAVRVDLSEGESVIGHAGRAPHVPQDHHADAGWGGFGNNSIDEESKEGESEEDGEKHVGGRCGRNWWMVWSRVNICGFVIVEGVKLKY